MNHTQGYMVLGNDGRLEFEDWRANASDPEATASREMFAMLPAGNYWSISQRMIAGRLTCLLTRVERSEDDDATLTICERVTARVVFNRHDPAKVRPLSETFLFPLLELQRPGLAARGVPDAVTDAFFIGQVAPLSELVD